MKSEFWINRTMDAAYTIAYRKRKSRLLIKDGECVFSILKPSFRYWYADPIVNEINGKEYVFCEMYDRIRNIGRIGVSCFNKKGRLTKPKVIISSNEHLSFPVVFNWGEAYYMWPCIGTETIQIYRMGKSEKDWSLWYENKLQYSLVDLIIEERNNKLYAITSRKDKSDPYVSCREVYEISNIEEPSLLRLDKIEIQNPAFGRAVRNGGKLFEIGDESYNVTQESTYEEGYGVNIVFNRIDYDMSNGRFREAFVRKISRFDIRTELDNKFFYKVEGLHTYSLSKKYEIIDLKIRAFSLVYIYWYIKENLKILFKIKR